MSSAYSNSTAAWRKQQPGVAGVVGFTKDTVDKYVAGKEIRKNMSTTVHGACLVRFCFVSIGYRRGGWVPVGWARACFQSPLVHP